MTTHEIRNYLHLTQEEFADRFNIPLGTVRNWDARGCMPKYTYNIFREYIDILNYCSELKSELELHRYLDSIDCNL